MSFGAWLEAVHIYVRLSEKILAADIGFGVEAIASKWHGSNRCFTRLFFLYLWLLLLCSCALLLLGYDFSCIVLAVISILVVIAKQPYSASCLSLHSWRS